MFRFAKALVLAVCVAVAVGVVPAANAGIDGTLYVTNNTDKVVNVYLNGHLAVANISPNTSPGSRIWDDPHGPAHLRAVSDDGTREWTEDVNNDVSNYTWTLNP
jgi:hypothetical protein